MICLSAEMLASLFNLLSAKYSGKTSKAEPMHQTGSATKKERYFYRSASVFAIFFFTSNITIPSLFRLTSAVLPRSAISRAVLPISLSVTLTPHLTMLDMRLPAPFLPSSLVSSSIPTLCCARETLFRAFPTFCPYLAYS